MRNLLPPGLGLALAVLVVALASTATAQEAADVVRYTGRTVQLIEFQAPSGFDVDEIRYLIEQEEGQPYNPRRISRSAELLFRLGQFDDVQARVRETEGGIVVTFVLVPSPRIRRIQLRGVVRLPIPEVRAALGKSYGDPYVAGDETDLADQVARLYRERGFLDVEVTPTVLHARAGGRLLRLDVSEGEPYRVAAIKLLPSEIAGFEPEHVHRRLAPRLRVGKVYREPDLERSVTELLEDYRKAGFVEAHLLTLRSQRGRRLPVEVEVDSDTHSVSISLPIEAGRLVQARFEIDGELVERPAKIGQLRQRQLERVVGLRTAARASEAYSEDASRQLERWLRRRGFYHATVATSVEDLPWQAPTLGARADHPIVTEARVFRFVVERGPRTTLQKQDFSTEGNVFATTKDIRQVLEDASPEVIGHRPLFWSVLGIKVPRRYYTEGAMEEAVSVLRDWYRARGFLDVELGWSAQVPPDPEGGPGDRVVLAVTVAEGVRTYVEDLVVDLNVPLDPKLERRWLERVEGKPFNPAQVDELVREARGEVAELGFIDAKVEADREFSDDRSLVRLRLAAEKGAGTRFGKVIVQRSRHTHVGLIRREVTDKPTELLKPGAVFRPSAVAAAQARLLRMGLFDGVVLQPAQSSGRVRDVEILVNERKRFSFLFGAGVTAPDDGPRVSGEIRGRNLDGRGLSVFVRGRASLDWRFLLGVRPRLDYRASMGIELPIPPGLPVRSTIAAVANEELDEPSYRVRRSSVGVSLSWRGTEALTFDVRAEVQWRIPLRVDSVAQLSFPADAPIKSPTLGDYQTLPLLGASLTIDKRDDRFNPREGIYASISLDTTPGRVEETAPAFGLAAARVVGLIPLGGKWGLQLEAGGGIGWSYNSALPPVEWRFRLGGTGTLRGYPLESVGPYGQRPGLLEDAGLLQGVLPERRVPVGGNAFYRYTIEIQGPIPFLESWRFAVFHDAGNALIYGEVPEGIDAARTPVLHASVGIGLRRITPIGPLRFDVAFRPENFARIPGVPAGEVIQVHFAVGAL